MGMVSKPSKRIYMGFQGFRDLARGKKADYVRPLEPGECMIVSTDKGVMELRDAVDRLLGGQILCRIS